MSNFTKRLFLFLALCLYTVSLVFLLREYAAPKWEMYKLTYASPEIMGLLFLIFLLSFFAFSLPIRINKPSDLFLVVTGLLVCIPAIVAGIFAETFDRTHYYSLIFVLTITFACVCLLLRSINFKRNFDDGFFSNSVGFWIFVLWIVLALFLIIQYSSIMSFSGLDSIYEQREVGRADSLFLGYCQTYFGYFFSPMLLVIGLMRGRVLFIIAGTLGSIILFTITAEKMAFMVPIFIFTFWIGLKFNFSLLFSTTGISFIFSLVLFFSASFHEQSSVADFMAWYLGVRSFLTPGLFLMQYYDFFQATGFLSLSHVRGFDILIPAPEIFSSDWRWPLISLIVGEDHFEIPTLNANANFIASDGVASFGIPGVVFSLGLFFIFLLALDYATRRFSTKMVLLMLIPLALILTNISLFTAILSFGGGVFLFLCFWFRPQYTKNSSTDFIKKS